jgi:hypothetical protein
VTTNATLAAEASARADRAEPGSLDRKAAGSAAVALATTKTVRGARRALETLRDPAVRQAAEQLLDELTTDHTAQESTVHD